MDAPPASCSDNLGSLWQSSSRPLRLRRHEPWPTNGTVFRSMLSPKSLCYCRYSGESENNGRIIPIAPLWRNQPWVSELFQLLKAIPWPIPFRRDLLSQANGTIWHPRPELWALHVWPLDGSLLSSQSVS